MDTSFPRQQSDSSPSAIILYQTADGQTSLDVRLQEETVWLSLTQMAELFDRDKSVVSRHLGNFFREGENGQGGSCCKKCNNCRRWQDLPS